MAVSKDRESIQQESMQMKGEIRQIALVMARGLPYFQGIAHGVLDYARENERVWSYLASPEAAGLSVLDLQGWPGDGIIAAINTPAEAACAVELGVPVVNVTGVLRQSPVPRVTIDNYGLGVLAAEHFLERGFRRFAYYGLQRTEYSRLREMGFAERLSRSDFEISAIRAASRSRRWGNTWAHQQQRLERWLAEFPKPVAVFCTTDYRSRMVLNACSQRGLRVPEEVAILGVDDERFVCEHSIPPLSSIGRSDHRIGYQAAALLDAMMAGRQPAQHEHLIPPGEVVARQSTGTIAVENSHVAAAIEYMRTHGDKPINVEIVCEYIGVSRRRLQELFHEQLGVTPHRYLIKHRLERACRLLVESTRRPLDQIARESGFEHSRQLLAVFNREFGMSPSAYRKQALDPALPPPPRADAMLLAVRTSGCSERSSHSGGQNSAKP